MERMDLHKYREQLLRAVSRAAEALLTANEGDALEAVMKGMEIVGECLSVDRVQIWRNEMVNNDLHFVMRYEWLSELGKKRIEVPLGLSGSYSDRNGWVERFLRKEYINSPISKLPPDEAAFLGYYEMKSIVILPLFLNEEFIGFFSVDDCERERHFCDDEMEMMASTGLMFASVFLRSHQTEVISDTQKQLEEALQQALSASRAKGNFLSTISHEMRTPMNAIIGMTDIARASDDPATISESLGKISEASHHLLGIINSVLDMSEIEADRMELNIATFSLKEMMDKIIAFNKLKLEEKNHRFTVNVDKNLPNMYEGDAQRLTQIITNLLSNAIIYTPQNGCIKLSVMSENEGKDFYELRFEVSDTGIGISDEKRDRLFEMFEQLDGSIARKYGGTGLGLAIAKRLVELMDGKIDVKSNADIGSTFYFTVKLKRPSNPKRLTKKVYTTPPSFPGKRVLLVEDIEINRDIMMAQLKETNVTVDIAVNGREALSAVSKNPDLYDLVLMDIQMPEMDGLEATRRIRALGTTEKLPVVAVTANVFTDDVEQCMAAGMNGHIGKPVDFNSVYDTLNKYLR
ncbi:MAG: ATP-binding protein [Defluviitaleaceae bacterium]|nr:ATP-binding protein [Defluviitaleaceae bacterium]